MKIEEDLNHRSYQVTDYGEVPNEWAIVKIDSISDIIDPQPDHRAPKELKDGIPYVGVGDFFRNKQIDYKKTRKVVPEALAKQKAAFTIEEGDIAFGKVGTLGNPRRLPSFSIAEQEYALSATMVLIKPKRINSLYLYYFLQSNFFMLQVTKGRTGTTRPSLGIKVIRNFYCVLPSDKEQQRIAEILSAADEQIEETERLIEKIKELKQGLMQKLFTNGIDHNEFKETELGTIPFDWKVTSVKEVSTICTNGFVGTATPFYTKEKEGTLYLQSNNIRANKFDYRKRMYVNKEFTDKHKKAKVELGDLLTVQSGHIGTTAVVNEELIGAYCHALIITRLNHKEVIPKFVSYYLNSNIGKNRLEKIFVGSTIQHINVKDFVKFLIPLPKIQEQKKIAEILSSVDDQIEAFEKEKVKQIELKKALMQQLLTGKIRVAV